MGETSWLACRLWGGSCRSDDPVADYDDMFASVAPIDLGSFGDVESKLSATGRHRFPLRTSR